jgi:hypothetical protein
MEAESMEAIQPSELHLPPLDIGNAQVIEA